MSTTPESNYKIRVNAKEDIKSIAKYTLKEFGVSQSLKFAQGSKIVFRELANNPDLGKRYLTVKNKMVSRFKYKSHVIFYYLDGKLIFIVRVLGGRMEFQRLEFELFYRSDPSI